MATRAYLGGTFDPIHIAHMKIAEHVWRVLKAESVSFVVSAKPPHKQASGVMPQQRLDMAKLAAEELNTEHGLDGTNAETVFAAEDCEFRRPGLSYTVDTLRYLKERHPNDQLVWVIGMDSYNNLSSWHQWQTITQHANLLVLNRPGESRVESGDVAEWVKDKTVSLDKLGEVGAVAFSEMAPMTVSSTEIRETAPNLGLQNVSAVVKAYILENDLYTS